MALGDVNFTYGIFAVDALSETDTVVQKGDVVEFGTDGWTPAVLSTAGAIGPFGVSITADTDGSGQDEIVVVIRGVVECLKKAGTAVVLWEGVGLSDTDGALLPWTITDVGGTPDQSSINLAIHEAVAKVGICMEAAASGVTIVKVLLGW